MRTIDFRVEDMVSLGGDSNGAACNMISGPAFTLLDDDGKILAVGGVRCLGIGQAWARVGELGKTHRKTLLKTARQVIEECIARERLVRVYAEATVDTPAWFKHLGFQWQNNILVR